MTPKPSADLTFTLTEDAAYALFRDLRQTLSEPPANPKDRDRWENAIIARVIALQPANSVESKLVGLFIVAAEQSKYCIRIAQHPDTPPQQGARSHAWALAMMRQANAAIRSLVSLQTARRRADAHPETADRGNRAEHLFTMMFARAKAQLAVSPESEESPPPKTETPVRLAAPTPAPRPRPAQPAAVRPDPAKKPVPDPYAGESPRRRALLDAHAFGPRPPDPNRRYPGESAAMLLQRLHPPQDTTEPDNTGG